MNPYFIDFYNNWTKKAQEINGNSLSNVYDKYITLYVIYNNLYNQIPNKLISKGILVRNKIHDNYAATELVIKFLEANEFLKELNSNKLNEDVETIIDLINREVFHIKIIYGQPSRNEDLKILKELKSFNDNQRAIAILKVLYHVRCNIFHGSKNFEEQQRILVEPLTRIIEVINPFLYRKINE